MFRSRIREVYDRLSSGYQRLAAFLLDHYQEAVFMNATQLAKACGLDSATIVRFAQVLGYKGYVELRADMRAAVRSDLGRADVEVSGEGPEAAAVRALAAATDHVSAAARRLDLDLAAQILALLDSAVEVAAVGEGTCARLADLFAFLLRGVGVQASAPALTMADLAPFFRAGGIGGVVVALAVEPITPDLAALVRMAHARAIPVIALVGADSWEIGRLADIALVTGEGDDALAASLALLTALSAGLTYLRGLPRDTGLLALRGRDLSASGA